MKNSLFDRFVPKEDKFFPLLSQMAEAILTASNLVVDCVQAKDHTEALGYFKKIKEQERKGDSLETEIFEELNNTFITPFDREDINALSNRLDDVVDHINSCAKRITLYKPKSMPESAKLLAMLVRDSAEWLVKAVGELDNLKKSPEKVRDYCEKLHEIESKADDIYEHFLIDLFENEKDATEVIKLKDILHELERATDTQENVGKIIKTIIVKYS
ncbi:DUF47 family protein [Dysgonomonas sp. OttesenSCG-928-M03]|nr:DUF47 family protein [Dysgonomonas sp. OttesenSCG-928-M03]